MAAIEIKNVKKVYGHGDAATVALKGVDFSADTGNVVLLMGPSGAGKSTLLTIMGALQTATSGKVEIDGQDISRLKEKGRSRLRLNKLGFILQAYNLVPYLTVKEQFQLVDKVKKTGNLRKEELKDLLADLGIENLVKKYPENLSGGQKQRVAIAGPCTPIRRFYWLMSQRHHWTVNGWKKSAACLRSWPRITGRRSFWSPTTRGWKNTLTTSMT